MFTKPVIVLGGFAVISNNNRRTHTAQTPTPTHPQTIPASLRFSPSAHPSSPKPAVKMSHDSHGSHSSMMEMPDTGELFCTGTGRVMLPGFQVSRTSYHYRGTRLLRPLTHEKLVVRRAYNVHREAGFHPAVLHQRGRHLYNMCGFISFGDV